MHCAGEGRVGAMGAVGAVGCSSCNVLGPSLDWFAVGVPQSWVGFQPLIASNASSVFTVETFIGDIGDTRDTRDIGDTCVLLLN